MEYALTLSDKDHTFVTGLCLEVARYDENAWKKHEKFPGAMLAIAKVGMGKKVSEKQIGFILDVAGGYALALDKLADIEKRDYSVEIKYAMNMCQRIENDVNAQKLQASKPALKLVEAP